MQSWNLSTFVKRHGVVAAGKVWGVSHQAVSKAVAGSRDIRIVRVEGFYTVHESKLLNKISIDKVKL